MKSKISYRNILCILILFVIIGSLIICFSKSEIANENDFSKYADTYLITYKQALDNSNVTSDDLEHFKFYKGYPYAYAVEKSTKKGAMVEFIPSNLAFENNYYETDLSIEDYICSLPLTHNPASENYIRSTTFMHSSGNVSNLRFNGGSASFILYDNASIHGLDISTSGGILITENSTVYISGTNYFDLNYFVTYGCFNLSGSIIDDKRNVIIKNSNLKEDWSRKQAEKDALEILMREQLLSLVEQSHISGEGYSEISNLVQTYLENGRKGVYDGYRITESDDLNIIFDTCAYYGYDVNLARELESQKQNAYYEESNEDEFNKGVNYLSNIGLGFTALLVISFIVLILVSVYKYLYEEMQLKESIINYLRDIIPGSETFIEAFSILKKRK